MNYLDFRDASCKNCYKCLRSCPVKAIAVTNHQARIIEERCILCGTCTSVCPQNAKCVHSEKQDVLAMLASNDRIIASVAPSFVSSFGVDDFSIMQIALGKLGFAYAEETAVGAKVVVNKYNELLQEKTYKNFITSSCSAVNTLIQLYYPKALPYLAPVDSPMVAHAKILKKQRQNSKIVFIGPCIAKKKEAQQSGLIDAALTFEDLSEMLADSGVKFDEIAKLSIQDNTEPNKAKYFPISRGIIKSFDSLVDCYEYVAIDGIQKCMEILENIDSLSGMFLELNACDYSCVNGPCSLIPHSAAIKSNASIRKYVNLDLNKNVDTVSRKKIDVNIETSYPKLKNTSLPVSNRQIEEILAKTGKLKKDDELNCGACGYVSCREKAWAVANGYAEVEMCLPYMRERAETMAFEILQHSPNGILVLDSELKIIEINSKAKLIYGIDENLSCKGKDFVDFANPTDFMLAQIESKNVSKKKVLIDKTNIFVDMTIIFLKEHNAIFGFLTDVTDEVNYDDKLNKVRSDTIETTDAVIKKQMRVAQEIASLLGETTAETKVALLKLKKVLSEAESNKEV